MFHPVSWVGPVLDKELRVSSRRRRNYLLRVLYLGLLTAFVCITWARSMFRSYDPTMSRMAWLIASHSAAAKAVTVTVCVFQFWAVQILAVILLSSAISDEITSRTLGVLMTTPVTSRQIILGKLSGRLLQLISLAMLGLPVLAILRIFGGVPWGYLVSSTCITMTTAIFFACVSLFFSIGARSAYVAIIRAMFLLGIIFLALPIGIGAFFVRPSFAAGTFRQYALIAVELLHPYAVFMRETAAVFSPGRVASLPWGLHCIAILVASIVVITIAAIRLRKVALREATGQHTLTRRERRLEKEMAASRTVRDGDVETPPAATSIRRVVGSPILWKDTVAPFLRGATRRKNVIAIIGAAIGIIATYLANHYEHSMRSQFVQSFYIVLFVLTLMLIEAIISATSITTEKESRAWPILLATPLSSWQIVRGKVMASMLKTRIIWIFLAAHLIIFATLRYIHPIALVHVPLIAIPVFILMCCSGLYFSILLRKSTSAVAANLGFAAAFWIAAPTIWGVYSAMNGAHSYSARVFASINPLVTSFAVITSEAGWRAREKLSRLDYTWPFDGCDNVTDTTVFLLSLALLYAAMAVVFLWRAKCRLRRRVFID